MVYSAYDVRHTRNYRFDYKIIQYRRSYSTLVRRYKTKNKKQTIGPATFQRPSRNKCIRASEIDAATTTENLIIRIIRRGGWRPRGKQDDKTHYSQRRRDTVEVESYVITVRRTRAYVILK